MAEQDLNDGQTYAVVEQVRGESVSERMRVQRLVDTGSPRRLLTGIENALASDRASWFSAGEEPVRGLFPSPVSDQHLAKRVGEHRLAVFVSLAAANPDDFTLAVYVAEFQVGRLGDPESGTVHDGQNGPMAEVPRRFEQSFDLFPARNDGQFPFILKTAVENQVSTGNS